MIVVISIVVVGGLSPVIEAGWIRVGISVTLCAVVGTMLEMRSKKE
ncbi:hypothetical protein [Actinoplanes utahensis]|nr:hypothetical protein [Actinoplanes utahensis]